MRDVLDQYNQTEVRMAQSGRRRLTAAAARRISPRNCRRQDDAISETLSISDHQDKVVYNDGSILEAITDLRVVG